VDYKNLMLNSNKFLTNYNLKHEPWKSPAPPVQLVSVSIAQIILTLPRSTLLKLTYLSI